VLIRLLVGVVRRTGNEQHMECTRRLQPHVLSFMPVLLNTRSPDAGDEASCGALKTRLLISFLE
jgi:hypothetical protein